MSNTPLGVCMPKIEPTWSVHAWIDPIGGCIRETGPIGACMPETESNCSVHAGARAQLEHAALSKSPIGVGMSKQYPNWSIHDRACKYFIERGD